MDFWKVVDGKIVDNRIMVNFPYVMQRLGVDPFNDAGWENHDSVCMPLRNGVSGDAGTFVMDYAE